MTTSAKRVDTQMVIWFRREGEPERKAVATVSPQWSLPEPEMEASVRSVNLQG